MNENKEVIGDYQVATDTRSEEHLFDSVVISIESLLQSKNMNHNDITAIGVGVPGLVNAKKGIAVYQSNIPWQNFPVVKRMSDHFGNVKVTIDNDVAVAAQMMAVALYQVNALIDPDTLYSVAVSLHTTRST